MEEENNSRQTESRAEETTEQKVDEQEKKSGHSPETVRCMNALAYVWILFFLPLVVTPEAPSSRFHANQGLVNLLFAIVVSVAAAIVGAILGLIPGIGTTLAWILSTVASLICLLFTILGIVWAAQGQQKELPIIGGIRLIK